MTFNLMRKRNPNDTSISSYRYADYPVGADHYGH